MDKNAIFDKYTVLNTVNATSWTFVIDQIKVSTQQIDLTSFMVVSFDPMVPYIYMPQTQWASYANIMQAYYRG